MLFSRIQIILTSWLSLSVLTFGAVSADEKQPPAKPNQYEAEGIAIPAADAEEPKLDTFSLKRAEEYLRKGTIAWSRARKCVACHTNGAYMAVRPSLTAHLGQPDPEVREFFLTSLKKMKEMRRSQLRGGIRPAQAIYIAAGLAEWDAFVSKKLSTETDEALKFTFTLQEESGTWGSLDCWPPHESSAFHLATVAAQAAATAPGWLDGLKDDELKTKVNNLKTYLRTTPPPHDYGKVLLLWASTRMQDLLTAKQRQEVVEMIWKHQREDGGWSMRTFAEPEAWGGGNRAAKIRSEPDFKNPPSDGHQTGLAVMVLRDAGVPAKDPRIQKAVAWLKSNQRQSGRWWTRSLNTDKFHFITYSGTIYPLAALAKCDELPSSANTKTASVD